MSSKRNILILYGYLDYPIRSSVRDLIYSFKKYSNENCYYYTPDQGDLPNALKAIDFDLIVFTTILISERWRGYQEFKELVIDKIQFLKTSSAIKVIHPQDEWIQTKLLCDFINEFGITHVFTVAPESEWKIIYNSVNFNKVHFHPVLTGYLDEFNLTKLLTSTSSIKEREIDVGYRAFKAPPWLGSHGYLKTKIAEVFNEKAPKAGFKTDISTNEKDVILGDDWYLFLAKCKYFIGVEGGSTVLDPEGKIWEKGTLYQSKHPNASFEEFKKNCFPGMDGNLKLIAISPRHLECCATNTCQVLIEGYYNGILKPNIHYIPIKKDFSDIDTVFEKMKDENLRIQIVNNAYKDIVLSQKYTYKSYVELILNSINLPAKNYKCISLISNKIMLLYNHLFEKNYWDKKRTHSVPTEITLRNILIKIYIYSGLRKLKATILR
jgi:hypothetical protein